MTAKPPEDLDQVLPIGWPRTPFWTQYRRVKRRATGNEELLSVYRDHGVILKTDRDDNFNKASEDLTTYQVVRVGDLVVNKMKAWQGSVAVSGHSGIVSPAYFVFESLGTNHPQFMHYLLRSAPYVAAYAAASKGIRPGQWDLDPGVLRSFPVPVLSTAEQVRIADFLDRETAEIDAFIADQEELIGLLNERRTATITHAVTKGLDASAPMKSSGLGTVDTIPASWDVWPFTHYAPHRVDYRGATPTKVSGGIPLVTARNVKAGYIDYESSAEYVAPESYADTMRRGTPELGDVLLTMEAPLGNVALVDRTDIALAQRLVKFRVKAGADPRFAVFAMISSYFQQQLLSRATGSTALGIKASKLSELRIAVPSDGEQKAISDYLERETAELDATIADALEVIALSKERRVALISAAVTGKLDVSGRA